MHIYGYGKILEVDLSSSELTKKEITSTFAEEYLGGMGFSCKILYDEVKPGVDPLGPENIVIFAVGPLTGTTAPCSGRIEITNRSPLTDSIGTGNSGGLWGAYLKLAGYDVVIVRGMAEKPVYLLIDGDVAELRDAAHLWGRDAKETTDIITRELSPNKPSKVSVMAIGQAGENLVKFACPLNDYHHVAGRGGAGAVLGSKKLKAIAVLRNKRQIKLAKPQLFHEAVKEARDRLITALNATSRKDVRKKFGFVLDSDVRAVNLARGCLPAKNFQTGFLPHWLDNMSQDFSFKYITRKESTCYACPMSCFDLVELNEGKYAGTKVTRGTAPGVMMDVGAKCALDNSFVVWRCKELCQNYGLDYASTAGVIAFAQELFQRGIITTRDTDGIELTWGNEEAVIEMIHRIAGRKGFGEVLAEGSVRAAKIIGRGSEKYVMCIKGMEAMTADPRASKRGWAFGEITNPRGGDNIKSTHFRAEAYNASWPPDNYDIFEEEKKKIYCMPLDKVADTWEGKPAMTKWFEDLYSLCNSLVVCFFPAGFQMALGPTLYSKMYSACTGRFITPREIMKLGEKVFNLLKAYTVREGFTRKDDCWADRFYSEPMPEGPAKGAILSRKEIDRLLDEYYTERGWNKEYGIPTPQKLRELGLDYIAADLIERGKLQESK